MEVDYLAKTFIGLLVLYPNSNKGETGRQFSHFFFLKSQKRCTLFHNTELFFVLCHASVTDIVKPFTPPSPLPPNTLPPTSANRLFGLCIYKCGLL